MNTTLPELKENVYSVRNSFVSGMFISTKFEILSQSSLFANKVQENQTGIEAIKTVSPWANPYILRKGFIIQSPENALKPHPILEQPEKVDFDRASKNFSSAKHGSKALFSEALEQMNELLKNTEARHAYEAERFELATIEPKHLFAIPEQEKMLNTTLGIRGVIAKTGLKSGVPLIYSAQFLNKNQWLNAIAKLGSHLLKEFYLSPEKAAHDAARRLTSYMYKPHYFESEKYYTPAYGAGNICAMINHDELYQNMTSVHVPMLDSYDNPTAGVYMLYTIRDIKRGEQLFVNYGDQYSFEPVVARRIYINKFLLDCKRQVTNFSPTTGNSIVYAVPKAESASPRAANENSVCSSLSPSHPHRSAI